MAIPSLTESQDECINILIVDDEPKNLTVLETILTDPSYRLVRADSADQALLALVKEEFALIVLDIQMPGMTGFELAQMVKQRKKTAGIPIIFLTAYYSEAEHVLEGYGTGAVDYLHKPVNPAILRSKVAVFAALHRSTRQIERANEGLMAEVNERRRIEEQLLQLNSELEMRVQERTSELSSAYAAMKESENLLRLAQEAGQVGIWYWDLRTGEGFWTQVARGIFNAQDLRDQINYEKWLSYIHPEDRERASQNVEASKLSGVYSDEFRICRSDNETRWVECVGAVEYENGESVRMRGTLRDVTDRKKMEIALKDADRRKDEFLAILAHELRNPLAPISNSVQIMRLLGDDPKLTAEVRLVIERQVAQMVRLVDDLLDVSRISVGKIELRLEPLEISKVINSAIETSQPLIERAKHCLNFDVRTVAGLRVRADFVRLTQVISNLLNNATKYTPEGGQIWLRVEVDQGELVIYVKDSGIGIPQEMLPKVFEMFTQIDRSLNRSQGGLGIGLSLVRRIVELHGGSVAAFSEGLGKGTEIVVRIPRLEM